MDFSDISAWCKTCYRCLQPGSSAIAATAQALQRRLCCVFIPSPSTHGPHSWRSSLAHVDECKFYLETWPLVTIQSHIIKQRLLTLVWRATFSVQYSPAKRSVSLFLTPPKAQRLQAFGVEVLLFNAGKFHGGGGGLACCEDGGGRQCGFRSPRL